MILVINLAAQSKIYWVDYATGKVQRSNTDGSSVQDLVIGLTDATGIAVDSINGKIYFGRGTSPGKIQRANLDGSSVTDLITGMANVVDIALDVNNGKIYWTSNFDQKIQRANLDGSNVQDLLTGRQDPAGISVDTVNGKIYWVERVGLKICRANLDGSSVQDLITSTSGLSSPYGLELDLTNSKMYFSDFGTGKIQRANLDGTGMTDVLTGLGFDVDAVAVDPRNSVIYYATYNTSIGKVNYSGAGNASVVTGLGTTSGIHFYDPSFTISGNVGAVGATLSYTDGIAKTATSDGSGNYTFQVSYDWSGTVTPSKTGYTFTPANRTYTNVLTNQTSQDYVATAITYTISGNVGIAGATLSYTDGSAKTATANGSGDYSFTVSYNWSGTVTPSLAGYTFTPANRTYTNVLSNQTSQDYTAAAITYTISGNAGAAGVTLSYTDGSAKTATADGSGNYTFTVSYNWSGTVTPSLTGYTFIPANRTYTNVLANQTSQNYTATAVTYTISGNAGIAGATLSYTDGSAKTATADGSGNYSFTVSYNWSGTVTPSLTGYTFTPTDRTYTNVLSNQTSQDYTANIITYTISGNAGIAGATLSYNDGGAKTATADGSGNYSFTVSYNWSGTVTPSYTGYTFTPANRTYTNVLSNQASQDYTAAPTVYTISGSAGVAGATLSYTDGTPKTAAADGSGNYSFTVSYNWSGTVTPSLAGYTFTPTDRTYTNVLTNQTSQDYTATAITYTISGNAGIAAATLSYTDGTPKTATADGSGNYSFTVSYNWSSTVTPSLAGYTFTPANRTYTNVLANQTSQDYTATGITYTISGNAGTAGVTLSYNDGGAKTATADGSGNYSFTVSYNWSGTVTPSLAGYTFTPANRTYTNVLTNQTSQDYTATAITYTISGNAGIAGATLSYNDGGAKTATADGSGNYSFTVSYNWSGTVTPSLAGYTFTPANRTYTNVLSDQTGQDYTAAGITYTISGNAGVAGATLSYNDGGAKTAAADGSGNYSFTVSYNWSGAVTPSLTGYTFTPTDRTYTNVLADQTSQDYTAVFNAPVATAATNVQSTSFTANWNAAAGAVGYRLDVASDADFADIITGYNNRDVGNVTTFLVSSANIYPGSRYYYRVRAYNSIETSGNSNTIALQTGPAAPTATAASDIDQTSFSANWNPTSGISGYRLDVATDAGFTAFVTGYNNLDVGNVTTYPVNTGLTAGTRYYYRLRTYNATGTSSNSNTISLILIPGDPTATAATNILSNSFSANWNAVTGASGYYLDVATDAGFTTFVTGYNNLDVGNVTTYSVNTNLTPLTPYYYRVRAYNVNGTSGNSNVISLTTIAALPTVTTAAVNHITYSSANSGGNVTDNGGAPVTARGVCWSTSPNPTIADYITVNGSGDGAFTGKLLGLQEFTTYYVRAYATNSSGTGYGQQVQFTTNAQSMSVTITEPLDNAEVSGTVIIKASTSVNLAINADSAHRAVSRVEFHIDGVKIAEDTSAPYETSWDTTTVSDGSHAIKAVAYNLADQASQAEITVQVTNTPPQPPHISLNRTKLNFGAVQGDVRTGSQYILVDNTGAGTLNWTAAGDAAWLLVTPGSGSGAGVVTVSVNPAGLSTGLYGAAVTFEDANADNSPQTVAIKLTVYDAGSTNPPFGSFDTPEDGSTVMSSVPVTGWALDDIEAVGVKLYRSPITGEGEGLVYIGDAIFVEGARPDIETSYPDYPFNYRAGWGYMLLTNFLPNGGNGTFTLHAIVTDKEGHEVTLGTKTITCDNAHAVKPFGAIDTPAQGGEAAGKSYLNYGWTLTPQPNTVPKDGSTIGVWVDGLQLGNPVYDLYREDIASLFPGYNNSDGAVGYYYLDTTVYANGVHTIAWTVTDDAGNSDGIGSRYFTIVNTTSPDKMLSAAGFGGYSDIRQAPISGSPVYVRIGYPGNKPTAAFYPDQDGVITIRARECERVEIRLNDNPAVRAAGSGYLEVGDRLRPLPVGSTLNRNTAIFAWQPGPGFLGEYRFVFGLQTDDGQVARKIVKVQIVSEY